MKMRSFCNFVCLALMASVSAQAETVSVWTNAVTVGLGSMSYTKSGDDYAFGATGSGLSFYATDQVNAEYFDGGGFSLAASFVKSGAQYILSGTASFTGDGGLLFSSSQLTSLTYVGSGLFAFSFLEGPATQYAGNPYMDVAPGSLVQGHLILDALPAGFGTSADGPLGISEFVGIDGFKAEAAVAPVPLPGVLFAGGALLAVQIGGRRLICRKGLTV